MLFLSKPRIYLRITKLKIKLKMSKGKIHYLVLYLVNVYPIPKIN